MLSRLHYVIRGTELSRSFTEFHRILIKFKSQFVVHKSWLPQSIEISEFPQKLTTGRRSIDGLTYSDYALNCGKNCKLAAP